MQQLAADSPFFLSAGYEETATFLLDRSDFWAVVMGESPNLPEPLSLPELSPELPQVEEEALKEHVPELPRRNPPRAAKPQEPLLTDMRPDSLRRVEDEALGANVPKRPRRVLPSATKPREQEACPSLPDPRPNKRPAEDKAPDEHKPKRGGVNYPRIQAGACPYNRPLFPTRELVVEAFLSDPHKQMSIKEIKEYLQTEYPWFTWGSARRKVCTTIRGALGDRRLVLKPFEEVPEQQGYWRLRAEYLHYLRKIRRIPE